MATTWLALYPWPARTHIPHIQRMSSLRLRPRHVLAEYDSALSLSLCLLIAVDLK
jgi:hypothetical protein